MPNPPVALVIATHPQQCKALLHAIGRLGLRSALAFTLEDAHRALQTLELALVVSAPTLRDGTYDEVLRETQGRNLPLVLVLRHGEVDQYVAAAECGVADFLTFPFSLAEAEQVLRGACGANNPFLRNLATA